MSAQQITQEAAPIRAGYCRIFAAQVRAAPTYSGDRERAAAAWEAEARAVEREARYGSR